MNYLGNKIFIVVMIDGVQEKFCRVNHREFLTTYLVWCWWSVIRGGRQRCNDGATWFDDGINRRKGGLRVTSH